MVRAVQHEPSLQRVAIGPVRRTSGVDIVRTIALIGAPILLLGIFAWPMLFTNAALSGDWIHHLWLIWNQSLAIRADHRPSLFLNYSHAVLYPQYAFYGGTIYVIAGTLSLILGNAPIASYISTYMMGFAAAYGGWYWLARMAGLGRWQAQAPGLIFVSSAYYVTLVYGRGDWTEFSGVSMIPLLIASSLSVLRADRLRLLPALALAASAVIYFGSHSLTIVWGSSVMALTGILVLICIPQARGWLTWRGVLRVASLVIPALLISAWFLLPAIAYETHTDISNRYPYWRLVLGNAMFMVSASNLFTISRATDISSDPDFALSLPILAMVWSLIGIPVFLRRGLREPWVRMFLICVAITVLMLVVMTHLSLMLALPRPYAILQFSYRLESYVLLGVSATILAGLVLAQHGGRRILIWALVPVLIVAMVGAFQQIAAYPRYKGGSRQASIRPSSKPGPREEGWIDYLDADLTLLEPPHGRPREVDFSASSMHENRASKVVHLQPREAVYSNIDGGPEFVKVTGAKIIGINPEGNDVLEIGPSIGPQRAPGSHHQSQPTEVISIAPANSAPLVLGRLLTVLAAVFLAGELIVLAVREIRSRHAG
jgi:hypothetical protein